MDPAETVSAENSKISSEYKVLSWTAPARPFKRRDRRFYVTTFSMAGIVGLIIFLAEGLMPVLLIVSVVFLYYVMSTVEPENIEYKVSGSGLVVAGAVTEWKNFKRFWFSKRFDSDLAVLETFTLPGRMELVLSPDIKEEFKKKVSAQVPFEEVPASGVDIFIDWFSKKLPGNK